MQAVTQAVIKHNSSIRNMAVAQSGKNAVTKVMLDLDPDLDYHQNLSVSSAANVPFYRSL